MTLGNDQLSKEKTKQETAGARLYGGRVDSSEDQPRGPKSQQRALADFTLSRPPAA